MERVVARNREERMAIYELTGERLRQIEETSFSAAKVRERADLQRVLRSQIDVFAPNVLVIAEEFGDWEDSKRRIDLLGLDKDANLVVIELKRTEDGGHMELQAIRYAAMVSTMTFEKAVELYAALLRRDGKTDDARTGILEFLDWEDADEDRFAQDARIILVSAEFSKELTTAVMWLNDHGLDISCVRMKPYQDNGRILIDVQQVIPLPEAADYIVKIKEKEVRERTARREQSGRGDRYERFWTGLKDRAAGKTDMHRNIVPQKKSWFGGRYNAAGMNFVYAFSGSGVPRVEAYIFGSNDSTPKEILDRLLTEKVQIEGRFGSPLGWERLEGKIACRIRFDMNNHSFDNEESWSELQDTMVDGMIRFEKAMRPSLIKLGLQGSG